MTAHTPWTVLAGVYDTNPETASEYPRGPEVVDATGETVAYCPLHGEDVARLIAAAPDLLAALRAVIEACKGEPAMRDPKYNLLGIQCNNAIAKAEGRS